MDIEEHNEAETWRNSNAKWRGVKIVRKRDSFYSEIDADEFCFRSRSLRWTKK